MVHLHSFGSRYAGWATIALFGVAGCTGNLPEVEYVEGLILYEGKPLAGATVSFTPAQPGAGLPAYGKTGPDGAFRLTAALTNARGGRSGRGTAPGEYVVTVVKIGEPGNFEAVDEDPDAPRQLSRRPPQQVYLVPHVYSEVSKSPLRAVVKSGVAGSFTFKLSAASVADGKTGK